MCGIVAIAGKIINKNHYDTEAMLQKLKHRGPDGQGEITFPHCWLGHRRLAIVDLKFGNQPMVDDKLAITFNGEIYNHRELRNQLEKVGYHFQTQSDTETILKAYRMWGKDCPKYLDGMFAFAIWDDQQNELFIARDRLGKKPHYYFFDGDTTFLASEIKSLVASGTLVPEIDYKAIDNFLRVMYIPPWKSVYKNVHQIPPAHCGVYKDGKLSLDKYWTLPSRKIDISYEDAKVEVRRLLHAAIKKRISSSDVELGSFLSGGLDSSLVTLITAGELNHPLKVFSVSYDNHDELPFAKQVCEKIGGEHFTTRIDGCITQELDKIISYFDEPHADTSDFPQHLVSQLAAQKVKVVLSGDGADELFLGYKWHLKHKKPNQNHGSSDIFRNRLQSICAFPSSDRSLLWKYPDALNDDIIIKDAYKKNFTSIDNVTTFDLTSHLPGQILTKVDRASMMHGLEVRSPFLDIALIEFVFSLPYEYKVRNGEQKYILKDILTEYMPIDFVYRRKQGFGAPIERWLNNPTMKEYVYSKLGSDAKIRSIFSEKILDNYLHDFYINEHKHERSAQRLWVLLSLERWMTQLSLTL
ncbi:MAG: asparagine synthase (glutamine-hydrolyzing) [Candidatus Moraniibacteriota bacterium]|nr:MAG: asparagine synthase (glutamine-hydrolyzing) [Candidatus Moranbacteria bacterium]